MGDWYGTDVRTSIGGFTMKPSGGDLGDLGDLGGSPSAALAEPPVMPSLPPACCLAAGGGAQQDRVSPHTHNTQDTKQARQAGHKPRLIKVNREGSEMGDWYAIDVCAPASTGPL
jgi:hypothetical protein